MKLTTRMENNLHVLSFAGNLIEKETIRFELTWDHLIDEDNHNGIVVNLKKMNLYDSSGVGMLIFLGRKMLTRQKQFALCQLPTEVNEILQRMNMDKVINICPTEEEALKTLINENNQKHSISSRDG